MTDLENKTFRMLQFIEEKTKLGLVHWESFLMDSGCIKYIATIPASDVEIILFENETVPDIFFKKGTVTSKAMLRYAISPIVQPVEQAAISLIVEVRSRLREEFSYGNFIDSYLNQSN